MAAKGLVRCKANIVMNSFVTIFHPPSLSRTIRNSKQVKCKKLTFLEESTRQRWQAHGGGHHTCALVGKPLPSIAHCLTLVFKLQRLPLDGRRYTARGEYSSHTSMSLFIMFGSRMEAAVRKWQCVSTRANIATSSPVPANFSCSSQTWLIYLSVGYLQYSRGRMTTDARARHSSLLQTVYPAPDPPSLIQWRTQEFCSGGFNKFSWGQRTERTGIWGR